MKKRRLFAFLMLGICLLSGCRQTAPEQTQPKLRTVTRVQISYTLGKTALQRTYTTDGKIEAVLMYLRLLKEEGRTQIDPERLDGSSSVITLEYSDGKKNVYYQRCEQYLSRNGHPWQKIDQRQGRWLRPLLESIPSDEER